MRVTYKLSKGHNALKDGKLHITRGWGKGTVERTFAMRDGDQKLRNVAIAVRGFEIKGRIENFRSRLDYAFRRGNTIKTLDDSDAHPHGLRTNYAQTRFTDITDTVCPAAGGEQ